jgi:hypothetical protein
LLLLLFCCCFVLFCCCCCCCFVAVCVSLCISVVLNWLFIEAQTLRRYISRFSSSVYRVLFCVDVKARGQPMTCVGRHRTEAEVEPRHWSRRARNISLPTGFDHRTVQPIASGATD